MPVRVPVATAVLVLGLALGLVLGTVAVLLDRPEPPAQPERPAAAPPAESYAVAVLHDWDQRRAAAWAQGDPAALTRLYTAGSTAATADVALLRRYAGRGLAVPVLRMQLLRVRVLTSRPGRIVLEVTDRLQRAVVERRGVDRVLPADLASTRVLALRRVRGDWRMERVSVAER